MKRPDFTKAKPGVKVFSHQHGWGQIISIKNIYNTNYPIVVDFPLSSRMATYTTNGKSSIFNKLPDLWYDEWTPEPPESAVTPPVMEV